jgi:hypothetical protein
MSGDGAGRRQPDPVVVFCDHLQRAAQVPQPKRLSDDEGMQRNSVHQRLRFALFQHLLEIVDDGVGKCLRFPENLNVAAALGLAGIGAERTMIEVWADPKLTRNTHRIEVDADSASFSMMIENIPSENPKTGRITALSIISCLRKLTAPLCVGC